MTTTRKNSDYVKGDKNKLLKLKAEADDLDYYKHLNQLTAYFAMLLSALAVVFAFMSTVITLGSIVKNKALVDLFNKIIKNSADIWFVMCWISMGAVIVFAVVMIWFLRKNKCINHWRPYVLMAINDIYSEESQKNR